MRSYLHWRIGAVHALVAWNGVPSLGLTLGLLAPPGRELDAEQRRLVRTAEFGGISDPLLRSVIQLHNVEPRDEQSVERPHRGDEVLVGVGGEDRRDHRIHPRRADAANVVGALGVGRRRA